MYIDVLEPIVDVLVTNADGTVAAGADVVLEVFEAQASSGSMVGIEDPGLVAKKATNAEGKVRFGPIARGEYVAALSGGAPATESPLVGLSLAEATTDAAPTTSQSQPGNPALRRLERPKKRREGEGAKERQRRE